jgi:hypothetical protein
LEVRDIEEIFYKPNGIILFFFYFRKLLADLAVFKMTVAELSFWDENKKFSYSTRI